MEIGALVPGSVPSYNCDMMVLGFSRCEILLTSCHCVVSHVAVLHLKVNVKENFAAMTLSVLIAA